MTTLYAVNAGKYSDYHVIALFSTPTKAQEFMDAVPDEYNEVEEYELDPETARLIRQGYTPWIVHMRRDGTTEHVRAMEIASFSVTENHSIWRRSIDPFYAGQNMEDCLVSEVLARTAKHAVKAVNERRIQMIATGTWEASV